MSAVLVQARLREPIERSEVTLLFRRWRRCQAVAGHHYRTAAGRLAVDAVDEVAGSAITDGDARQAGYSDAAALVADLRGSADLPIYRLAVRALAGPDPRDVLAGKSTLTAQERRDLDQRLARLDRLSSHGPWTAATLRLIAERPGVRAPDLAVELGRETLPFKTDVRKLKSLGLTLSLPVGYRLSPRGEAYRADESAWR
ncbi:hypothetical protein ABN028_06710 [Actinopolymorpha sp. B17G11]|uniref:hypothetical protein n=1 Tax=Actinopolymorpha sp. B17G11 TaxID=3160861 RepID=UPI0032E4F6F0